MSSRSRSVALVVALSFTAGIAAHRLYLRWNPPGQPAAERRSPPANRPAEGLRSFSVRFAPLEPLAGAAESAESPLLSARDVEKIRALAGRRARIRGTVFRVGHSSRSNTYFLNFGPSRAALTAVIFASAVDLFEKAKISVKNFDGKDVEIEGEIKDHPQYGLEVVLERPSQIRVLK